MALIENTQVIAFANNRIRPMSDRFYSLYYQAKATLEDYNVGNIGSLINDAGAGNIIHDNSAVDGRTQITGGDIYNLVTAITAFVAYVEGGTVDAAARLDVLAKPHVNQF
jgi:hypothetical protein